MGLFSFFHKDQSEAREPKAEVLPDSRKRLTRYFKFSHSAKIAMLLDLDWGDVDTSGTAPTGWDGLRLTNRFTDSDVPAAGRDSEPILVLVYEQISATAETQVGSVETKKLEDGRPAKVYRFLQFSANAYAPQTVGSTTAPGDASAFLLTEEAPDDGTLRRITRTYVRGGQLSETIFRRGTLKGKTLVYAKTTPPTPSGYVVVDEQRTENPEGYPIYTYTFIALSDADYTTERYVDFLMPGRAKAFSETYNSRKAMDVFRSPPVTVKVKATITISYQTGNTLGTISDLWNPVDWATLRAQWIGFGNNPHNIVEALPGYRSVSETALEETAGGSAPYNLTIMSNPVYGSTTAKITVTGGPADPSGNTYTLDAHIEAEPAFITSGGTKYYRKTIISATIPSQASLPV